MPIKELASWHSPVTTASAVRRRTTAAPTAMAAAATEGDDWISTRDTEKLVNKRTSSHMNTLNVIVSFDGHCNRCLFSLI